MSPRCWSQHRARNKTRLSSEFSRTVRSLIMEKCSVTMLKQAAEATTDPKLRGLLERAVKTREGKIARERDVVKRELASTGVADLLKMLADADEDRKILIVEQIADRKLSAKDASQFLVKIWNLAGTAPAPTSANLRKQVEAALGRGSLADYMAWLADGDAELNKSIMQKLGPRIEKATAAEKKELRDSAVASLADRGASKSEKITAVDVLRRVKDPDTARLVFAAIPEKDQLKQIPLDLWPQVATMLRELTGQKFGPKAGERTLETVSQLKLWRKWVSSQSGATK